MFARAKGVSAAYATLFAVLGWTSMLMLANHGLSLVAYPLVGGFMLVAPVMVTGYYHAAQRLRDGDRPRFGGMLLAPLRSPPGLWFIAFLAAFLFLVWITDALVVYSIYLGFDPMEPTWEALTDPVRASGVTSYLLLGSVMGLVIALAVFTITVFSVPMVFHRQADFVRAIVASVRSAFANIVPLTLWGAILAGTVFVSLLLVPLFPVAFPVLAYASDEAYRDVWGSDE